MLRLQKISKKENYHEEANQKSIGSFDSLCHECEPAGWLRRRGFVHGGCLYRGQHNE